MEKSLQSSAFYQIERHMSMQSHLQDINSFMDLLSEKCSQFSQAFDFSRVSSHFKVKFWLNQISPSFLSNLRNRQLKCLWVPFIPFAAYKYLTMRELPLKCFLVFHCSQSDALIKFVAGEDCSYRSEFSRSSRRCLPSFVARWGASSEWREQGQREIILSHPAVYRSVVCFYFYIG